MEGVERRRPLWKNLRERLGFNGMGLCGSSWSLSVSDMTVREDEQEEEGPPPQEYEDEPAIIGRVGQLPAAATGMNLATALAAERNVRNVGPTAGAHATTLKSLMRLFEATDGGDVKSDKRREEDGGGVDGLCSVCMERDKGAAFIPCGHTYCRVCSRELWLNRGSCPLCNRSITEILDIF